MMAADDAIFEWRPPVPDERMRAVHDEIKAALVAGLMTEAEAKKRMEETHRRLDWRRRTTDITEIVVSSLVPVLKELVERETISEDTAKDILGNTKRRLGRKHTQSRRAHFGEEGREISEIHRVHVMQVLEEVARSLAENGLTDEQVHVVLEHVHKHLEKVHVKRKAHKERKRETDTRQRERRRYVFRGSGSRSAQELHLRRGEGRREHLSRRHADAALEHRRTSPHSKARSRAQSDDGGSSKECAF